MTTLQVRVGDDSLVGPLVRARAKQDEQRPELESGDKMDSINGPDAIGWRCDRCGHAVSLIVIPPSPSTDATDVEYRNFSCVFVSCTTARSRGGRGGSARGCSIVSLLRPMLEGVFFRRCRLGNFNFSMLPSHLNTLHKPGIIVQQVTQSASWCVGTRNTRKWPRVTIAAIRTQVTRPSV